MNFIRSLTLFINDFFLGYIIVYGSILFLTALVGAVIFYVKKQRKDFSNVIERDYYIPVSILVPAWNEEITIVHTIESLLHLNYKLYEIIVIDDGSSDKTSEKVIEKYKLKKVKKVVQRRLNTQKVKAYYEGIYKGRKIILVQKENGGKADALNAGINASSKSYFVTIDADSVLQKESLKELARPIVENSEVIACGGLVTISNGMTLKDGNVEHYQLPDNFIEMIQTLEYDRTFLAARAVLDTFNGNIILSGAFCLIKKDVAILSGGFSNKTVGEDMEIIIRLHDYCRSNKIPYRIKYVPEAICYTQVPSKLKDFKKQRQRWHTGLFQSLTKHHKMFLNPRFGLLGFVTFPYYWVYELIAPITETIGIIFIIISYLLGMINIHFMIIYFAIYILFCTVFTITTFYTRAFTEKNKISITDTIRVIVCSFLENFGFRQLANYYRLTAFFKYRKNKLKWGKITRK